MSGGRRKSRKPQKWEDYVADEEQLASIEKELVKEEKARMKSASNDGDSSEKSPDNDQNEEGDVDVEGIDDNTTDEKVDLEISILKEEEKELQAEEELIKEQICEDDKGNKVEVQEEKPQSTISATDEHVIGDCTMCGIQLRNWASTHNHLRFHRLSHVPDCNYERLNCQVCQRSCQNREVLAYHIYTEHYIKCKEVKTCPFCCSNFKDLEEFQEHLDINVITFKCQVCGVLVNQEHKFYKHILYCAQHHQPGITSLQCCICGTRTSVTKFYMHLLQHSTMLNLPRHLAHNSIRPCDLCGLSGFLNEEMLVRHCILRCAQRNNLQASFAAVVSSLAKKQNIGFTETLQSNAMQTYLKLGVEAWRSPLYVKQYLEKLQANNNPLVPSSGNRRDSGEFTDVQLLAYLDQFEALNRDKDKELELLLNIRSKGNRGNQMEILTFDDTPSSTQADLETQVSERETLGAEDPLWYSPGIGRKLVTSRNATSNNSQVDLSCLMQHLRKGSDKRSADEVCIYT